MHDPHLLAFLLLLVGAMMSTTLVHNIRRYYADVFGATAAEAVAGVKLTAMGFMGEIRNAAMTEAGTQAKFASTFKLATAVTGIKQKASSTTEFEKTAHGLETGNVVWIKSVAGPTVGLLKAGETEFFYVTKISTSVFTLSQTETQVAEEVPITESVSSMEVQVLETSSEAPLAVAWAVGGPERGNLKSKEKYEVAVPLNNVVAVVGFGKKSTYAAGAETTKPLEFRIFEKVAEETMGASKKYGITETNLAFTVQ